MKFCLKSMMLSCIVIHFWSCLSAQQDTSYNLLWKIEKEGVPNKGYLFGTMHVFDDRAFQFADSVMLALDECSVFAMEVHPDSMVKEMLNLMMLEDTTNYLKSSLSEEEYERFLKDFEEETNMNFEDLDSKHPLNVKTFDNDYRGNNDRNTFVDLHLFGVAKTLNKETIGLEPVENQLEYMFDRTIKRARFGIKTDSVLEKMFLNQMIDRYNKGNIEELNDLIGKGFAESHLMVKRNIDMAESIMNQLQEKSLFSAVGAGHLMGTGSVISILRENGFTVKRVSSNFTGISENYKVDPANYPWDILVDLDGGYQLNFPVNYNELDQEHPIETELGFDTVLVKIKMHSDLVGMKNLVVAYNDFPLGYYLESKAAMFEGLEEELSLKGTSISSTEDIDHNGTSVREYNIIVGDRYHGILHVFTRGNRVYRLFTQNLTPGEAVADRTELLRGFKLLPYAKSELKTKSYQEYKLPYFSRGLIQIDSLNAEFSTSSQGFNWFANDPTTGNTQLVSIYSNKDFFFVKDLDSFYIENIEIDKAWSDSTIRMVTIFNQDVKGLEVVNYNQLEGAYTRSRYWLYDDYFVTYSIYSDSAGIYCDNSEAFISADIFEERQAQNKIMEDKTSIILENLFDQDSLISIKSINALEYNDIDSSYAEQLESLLLGSNLEDTMYAEQHKVIMELLYNMPSFDPRNMCHSIVNNHNASDYLRACSISKTYQLGDTLRAIDQIFENTPVYEGYYCDIFGPFNNSNKLTSQYLDKLLPLMEIEEHRNSILYLLVNLAREDTAEYEHQLTSNYRQIISYLSKDLESGNEVAAGIIYQYASFFQYFQRDENTSLIEKIDTTNLAYYIKTSLVLARIYNDMELNASMINESISDIYSRFPIQKALLQKKRFSFLPDSLRSSASIYKSRVQYHVEDDYCYDCEVELIGKVKGENKSSYLVYLVTDNYEEEPICQLVMINKTRERNEKIYDDLKSYTIYLEDCDYSNWKNLAKESFQDYEEYAY